jgi:hypothetical protein
MGTQVPRWERWKVRCSTLRIEDISMNEVQITTLVFFAFWPLAVLAIVIAGRRWSRARPFADKMLAQWKPALAAALIVLLGSAVTGQGLLTGLTQLSH